MAERLLDGRFAGRPGWTVDRFGAMGLIQSYGKDGADPEVVRELCADLMARDDVQGVVLKQRGARDRSLGEGSLIAGALPESSLDDPFREREGRFVIDEGGCRFGVDLLYGVNVGLFLDAQPMRGWVRDHSRDRRVLNLFSYTSSFGVAAAQGGARSTTNVDLVPSALERGKANYVLNGLEVDPRGHARSDVFEFLRRAGKRGTTWELIICDPPPVPTQGTRGGKRRKSFDPAKDMERLLRSAMTCVAPEGALLALSAARGESRFEAPLHRVLTELDESFSVTLLSRAPGFPGAREEGLRALWIERGSQEMEPIPQV